MIHAVATGTGLARPGFKAVFLGLGLAAATLAAPLALAQDPMASNNGFYPTAEQWPGTRNIPGTLRISNLDYPETLAQSPFELGADGGAALTRETAEAYALKIKATLEPSLRAMIEDPHSWTPNPEPNPDDPNDPSRAKWYDLVWSGATNDKEGATGGREAILNTYTGQILPPTVFSEEWRPKSANGDPVYIQNHAVILYNEVAAYMLGNVFGDLYAPKPLEVRFPDGSIVVKAEAATPTPEQWPILTGAAEWTVFRPTTLAQHEKQTGKDVDLTPVPVAAYPLQMSVKVKDTVASPDTGWVYMGFIYDARITEGSPWDKFIPFGVMWGNDPDQAVGFEGGVDPSLVPANGEDWEALQETWINPDAPGFILDTLGWGDRLAGPMDVATRTEVITPSGRRWNVDNGQNLRASSCMSCHGAAEFPFTANLYPSPNKGFPPNGQPFLLYDPGSEDWARWFQNRRGNEPMSGNIGENAGLDYDMAIMFAISTFNGEVGNDGFVLEERIDVH